jgi:hypothetical protein
MYSRRIPLNQLLASLGTDFKSLDHIKKLVYTDESGSFLVGSQNFEEFTNSNSSWKNLKQIYDPNFWSSLIYLYFKNIHIHISLFPSTTFNPTNIPKALLFAIYCKGYSFYTRKTPELTDYLNQLQKNQLKKILFKPTLENLQALLIYCLVWQNEEHTKSARAYLSQLTRMAYCLGIHIDTSRFSKIINYTRQLVYRKVAMTNKHISGAINIYPNYIMELLPPSKKLYDSKLLNSPLDNSLLYLGFNIIELNLISKLAQINNRFMDLSIFENWLIPNNLMTNKGLEAYCLAKFHNLKRIFNEAMRCYELLIPEYSSHSNLIKTSKELITLWHITQTLELLEYWKFFQNSLHPELITQVIENCKTLTELAAVLRTEANANYYIYLAGFTLIRLYKFVKVRAKRQILSILESIRELLEGGIRGGEELDKFNNLVFMTGFKLMQSK